MASDSNTSVEVPKGTNAYKNKQTFAPVLTEYKRKPYVGTLEFPENIGDHYMQLTFRQYTYVPSGPKGTMSLSNSGDGITVNRTLLTVCLPIPTNLQDQNEARIGRHDANFVGDKISGVADAIADNDLDAAMGALTKADGSAIAKNIKAGNWGDLMKDSMGLLKMMSPTIAKSASVGSGVAANPRAALVYDGHELKTHSFMWNFAPRTENESVILSNIIREIKKCQLPVTGGSIERNTFLEYPCIVDITLHGVDQNFFYPFKSSMMRSFNVNFSGQNAVSILKGGRPSSVNIEMNLMEMDIHYASEY